MRCARLWEEYVLWTRLFIVSDVFNSPDLPPTTARLLANQVDIGNAVKPFYGAANGSHLTTLLKRHILLAAKILAEAKAGNAQGVKRAKRAWYANANQIAAFLHGLNPAHWPLAASRSMMPMYLSLTLTEAVDQLTGKYSRSVHDFDVVENEILGMADTLSNEIIAQFSGRFRQRAVCGRRAMPSAGHGLRFRCPRCGLLRTAHRLRAAMPRGCVKVMTNIHILWARLVAP